MKAPEGADDRVTTASAVLAGELDGALDRLGTAIGEEDSTVVTNGIAHQLVDGDGCGGRLWVGEVVADVEQFAGLRRDAAATAGLAWPNDVTAIPERKSR